MIGRLKQSMQAMEMLMKAQNVTANNLANINTPGYKAENLFYHAYKDKINGRTVATPEPYQNMDMRQGSLNKTGNPYDFGIQGPGFFEVRKNGQTLLRRSGHFRLNAKGYLVDKQGARVMGSSGPVQLPTLVNNGSNQSNNVKVAKDGTISINGEDYGQLKLVQVSNKQKVERLGNSYYSAPQNVISKSNVADSKILQGYQEASNVNPLTGLVNMTKNMRLFQTQQRAMRSMDKMLSQVTNKLGKY
ncbi:MAG TPA: flagellar hook-basal body protein [Balneolaceae bacterium]|nr:flagellar hook-basal body protein [Balneolaceae bacterium]